MQAIEITLNISDAANVGFEVEMKDNGGPPVVRNVSEGSAAERAGVKEGSRLLRIQGLDTNILSKQQIFDLLVHRPLECRFLIRAVASKRSSPDAEVSSRPAKLSRAEFQLMRGSASSGASQNERRRARFGSTNGGREKFPKPHSAHQEETAPRIRKPLFSPEKEKKHQYIVGTCQQIEKGYFRLQGDARPDWVRPQEVLEKSLQLQVQQWKEGRNWVFVDEQLRSIRQDLFVQGIQNEFAVLAYAVSARMALEAKDLGQFNQCQTQLKEFYAMGLGKDTLSEFWAYRLLYAAHLGQRNEEIDCLLVIPDSPIVRRAMKIRSALVDANYSRYFRLGSSLTDEHKHLPQLLELFATFVRTAALANACQAYGLPLPMDAVVRKGHFESIDAATDFLTACKAVISNGKLDTRKSAPLFLSLMNSRKVKMMG